MSRIEQYGTLPLRNREIARYAHRSPEEARELIEACRTEATPVLDNRVCWDVFPCVPTGEKLDLGFTVTDSKALRKNLRGCGRVVLFAATVGEDLDRLIGTYRERDPERAVVLHALGAEAVEAVCDRFCNDLRKEYRRTRPRFSPGYGDLPLTVQRSVFLALGCESSIGITLDGTLRMHPSKSVTALVGIGDVF